MEKQLLKEGLMNSGAWHRPNKDNYWWKIAFKEFEKASGSRLSLTCGRCYQKVKEWIER